MRWACAASTSATTCAGTRWPSTSRWWRKIRHGRLRRDQALALVRHHEQQPVQHADKFCEWLGLDPSGLQFLLDRARSSRHWPAQLPGGGVVQTARGLTQTGRGLGQTDFAGPSAALPPTPAWTAGDTTTALGTHFVANSVLAHGGLDGYLTVGKGHP